MSLYINERKRHWRYWVWKRIRQNLRIPSGQATVFFLSGPSPEDLAAALKYGFKLRNIVAIDLDADAVVAARKSGCTAIQGELTDIVQRWDEGAIHGVIADYCCGLTHNAWSRASDVGIMIDGALCVNFQRGRESDAASIAMRNAIFPRITEDLHRGVQFACVTAAWIEALARRIDNEDSVEMWNRISQLPVEQIKSRLQQMNSFETTTYRSNRVLMDTFVGRLGGNGLETDPDGFRLAIKEFDAAVSSLASTSDDKSILREHKTIQSIRRRIAACKAVRTMRRATVR